MLQILLGTKLIVLSIYNMYNNNCVEQKKKKKVQ